MKNSTKKSIFNYSFFVILVILTFYIIFKKNNIHEFIFQLKNSDPKFISLAVLAMGTYLMLSAVNINTVLKALGSKVPKLQILKYVFVGFFFSAITPSSTGGQPAQIYYMSKDKVSLSHSLIALLIELTFFKVGTALFVIIGFCFHFDTIMHHVGNIKYIVFLGIIIHLSLLAGLFIIIFSKDIAIKFVDLIKRFFTFIRFKKRDEIDASLRNQIDEYHQCSVYLKENKKILIKVLIVSLIEIFIYYSIPYFVYLSLGLNDASPLEIILMQAVLYISVSDLPAPGAVGVNEGGFVLLFKKFFPRALLGSAMIITRGINFYLPVMVSSCVLLYDFIKTRIKHFKSKDLA